MVNMYSHRPSFDSNAVRVEREKWEEEKGDDNDVILVKDEEEVEEEEDVIADLATLAAQREIMRAARLRPEQVRGRDGERCT